MKKQLKEIDSKMRYYGNDITNLISNYYELKMKYPTHSEYISDKFLDEFELFNSGDFFAVISDLMIENEKLRLQIKKINNS